MARPKVMNILLSHGLLNDSTKLSKLLSSNRIPEVFMTMNSNTIISRFIQTATRSARSRFRFTYSRSMVCTTANLHRSRSTFDIDAGSQQEPTIFAVSSGSRRCAVGVIRLSGPRSESAIRGLCSSRPFPKPRMASVRKLFHPETKELLDKALVLWFPGPHSFTGEDCAEFHVHGGPAVISSVLAALSCVTGLKPAQPGDFTKRAFLNGKMDLTEVEGLGDLIHADTEAQRKQALRQMEGDLGQLYSRWRTALIKALANVEAFIDFSEEENIEEDIMDTVCAEVEKIRGEITSHLQDSRQGERLRDGVHIVILGEPNVGKSSLLNALCQRPAAIVSPIAGTTRDIVETSLDICGYPVLISDTAGLRDTVDVLEKEGVRRALHRARSADLKVLVLDSSKHTDKLSQSSITQFVCSHMEELGLGHLEDEREESTSVPTTEPQDLSDVLVVVNKTDLLTQGTLLPSLGPEVTFISCETGLGLDQFLSVLVDRIKILCGDPLVHSACLTQTRHRHHLAQCQGHLAQFDKMLSSDVVLSAERLRRAARELSLITGAISVEDVLDVIFTDFCIGK